MFHPFIFKEPGLIASGFVWWCWYQKKARVYFSHTPGEFYNLEVFYLEDINENRNHNLASSSKVKVTAIIHILLRIQTV